MDGLSDDLHRHVLQYCSYAQLLELACVSKRWKRMAESHVLWSSVFDVSCEQYFRTFCCG